MKFDREMLKLYAVTDRGWVGRKTLLEQIREALEGGVTMVQLREKDMPEEEFVREAVEVRELCHRYHVPLIINDNVEVALRSGADGVHVGNEDAPVDGIRRAVSREFIIGATCKSVAQAKAAERDGADYMGVGAVFPSPTKKAAVRITAAAVKDIVSSVSIPAVAIGGITRENAGELAGCGMAGIAVISAIFGAKDIREAAAGLLRQSRLLCGGLPV